MDFEEYKSIDLVEIETYLGSFSGGKVFLSKEFWNEGIGVVFISYEEKKNCITGKMMVELRRCLEELEAWSEGKAVILTGTGNNFSSGGDLSFAKTCSTPKDGYYISTLMQDTLDRWRQLPLLTVSLIHGPTLGGGAEIAIFSDFILATKTTKLGFVQGKMGIITAWGGTTRLVELLGQRQALKLLLTSKILNFQECLDIGLADGIVEEDSKLKDTIDWIRQLASHHVTVVRSFKKASIGNIPLYSALERERRAFYKTWGAEPNRQALAANLKHLKINVESRGQEPR